MNQNSDDTLNFVAGRLAGSSLDMNAVDSDLASWLVMSGDLLGSSYMNGPVPDYGVDSILPPPSHHHSNFSGPGDPSLITHKLETDSDDGSDLHLRHTDPRLRTSSEWSNEIGSPMYNVSMPLHHPVKNSDIFDSPSLSPMSNPIGVGPADPSLDPSMNIQIDKSKSSKSSSKSRRLSSVNSQETLTSEQKRQIRLEKNRLIARNCRKRKREKYSKLDEEIVRLRQHNKQLEIKLNIGRDGRDREVARSTELRGMKNLLEGDCTEAEIRKSVSKYKEMYSDFGRERSAAINFHMSHLKNLLLPNTVSRMTIWSLQQDDEFYDETKNQKTFGGGIWNILASELRLTDEQKQALLGMRHQIRKQRKNVAACLNILKELENRVSENFESMSTQMDMIMNTILPSQQARFLLWIEKNKACTTMIKNMWNTKDENTDADSFSIEANSQEGIKLECKDVAASKSNSSSTSADPGAV